MYKFSKIQKPYLEFIPETQERNSAFQKLKKLYDSSASNNSTLSMKGVDSSFIKS